MLLWPSQRETGFLSGPPKVLLVAAADDELVLPALEQVPVAGRAVSGDVLVDSLVDLLRYRMSRNSPGLRNFSGFSWARGSTCSFTRRVWPWLMRQRRLTASASPIRSRA
jgi:hypothetical protein